MNLIEQLGGYEYLNEFYKRAVAHGFTLTEIKEELLKYRRQHNIFETDDYIIHDGELKVFAMWSTAIEGCAYIGYAYAEDGEMAKNDEFRHATDAEIKADRCLDQ